MNSSPIDETLWEAMADPTRRKLIDLLVTHGPATATTLTTEMPVSRQAITKQLQVLQRVNLVETSRHGRDVRYHVREERLTEATRALSEVANRWERRLTTIKHLAEQAHAADRQTNRTTTAP